MGLVDKIYTKVDKNIGLTIADYDHQWLLTEILNSKMKFISGAEIFFHLSRMWQKFWAEERLCKTYAPM